MRTLKGIGVAPGIATGPVVVYARVSFDVEKRVLAAEELSAELSRFEQAVQRAERDLKKIIALTREKLGEDSASIFEAQQLILRDDALYNAVVESIRRHNVNAEYAVKSVMSKHRQSMESSDSEYLRERANDLLDIQDRIIRHLRRGVILSDIPAESIVVAENLTAADIILFSRKGILGCATDFGGPTSHVSIMARALGVPAIVGMHDVTTQVTDGQLVVVDGLKGELTVEPDEAAVEFYRRKQERYARLVQEDMALVPLPSETLDGHHINLEANLELRDELPLLNEYGAEGIGLFRTEIILLMENRLIVSEAEQFELYRDVVKGASPGHTTFRMLDLGGDKLLPMGHREQNPFLGWRGIRILLQKPDLLVPQLRAILRASAFGPVRILLPMITTIDEIRSFRRHYQGVQAALEGEGVAFDPHVPVGIMIEVPAAALSARDLAQEVDFFSIGTNDLTQYVMAVDRGNDLVSELYDELHPAVLRLIHETTQAAHEAGIPVSLCGELAANLRAVPVLIGLGITALSASPVYLPGIKRVVRAMRKSEGVALAERAMASSDAAETRAFLDQWLEEHACGLSFFLDGARATG
ncbi:MAG: phosphoenolpyruvate--protein phosphotransferase [Rhodothermales bacterium]